MRTTWTPRMTNVQRGAREVSHSLRGIGGRQLEFLGQVRASAGRRWSAGKRREWKGQEEDCMTGSWWWKNRTSESIKERMKQEENTLKKESR